MEFVGRDGVQPPGVSMKEMRSPKTGYKCSAGAIREVLNPRNSFRVV